MTALAVQNDTAVKDTPIIAHPWGDFDTVLRHAEKARVSGEPNRAYAFFARAIELNPNEPRAWAGLAPTAPTLDEAIISWAYTLALAPDNLEAKSELDARVQERLVRARRDPIHPPLDRHHPAGNRDRGLDLVDTHPCTMSGGRYCWEQTAFSA